MYGDVIFCMNSSLVHKSLIRKLYRIILLVSNSLLNESLFATNTNKIEFLKFCKMFFILMRLEPLVGNIDPKRRGTPRLGGLWVGIIRYVGSYHDDRGTLLTPPLLKRCILIGGPYPLPCRLTCLNLSPLSPT